MANVGGSRPWLELLGLRMWSPLSESGFETIPLSERLRKVAVGQYLLVVEADLAGRTADGPFVTKIVWAEGDGAALRAIDMRKESDEVLDDAIPPRLFLPEGAEPSYGAIVNRLREIGVEFLESDEYRIGSDGAFVQKVIHAGQVDYCFRGPDFDVSEKLYSIVHRLMQTQDIRDASTQHKLLESVGG